MINIDQHHLGWCGRPTSYPLHLLGVTLSECFTRTVSRVNTESGNFEMLGIRLIETDVKMGSGLGFPYDGVR